MPRHANRTSFKPGHHNPEWRAKQSETLKRQYAEGLRLPPECPWTDERRETYKALAGTGLLDRLPIGTTRLRTCGIKTYRFVKIGPGRNGWKYEHRHVMETILGRSLLRAEHVHHINGDTLDNKPENLQLLSAAEHSRLHGKEKDVLPKRELPNGRWSIKHECCIICNLTTSPHASKGKCHRCNERARRVAGA